MPQQRKICVITGTRADYGLLSPLIQKIILQESLDLALIVTAMHLSPEFGLTRDLIIADGVPISAEVDMLLSSDTALAVTKSLGLGLIGMADALNRCEPDLVVLLGDRFEILGAAQAAMIARVPIAHIHGGEITCGAIDDPIRHSITKMSQIHFTSTDTYRRRVVQMGEQPDRVFNVGAIGLDRIRSMPLMTRTELEDELSFSLGEQFALVTFHPETMEAAAGNQQLSELLEALDDFPELQIVMTFPNADVNYRRIIELLEQYARGHPQRVLLRKSLGDRNYLSALNIADVVVGNSSSGIIEAPSLKTATVNIGGRQEGRVAARSVLHCEGQREAIRNAISRAVSKEFRSGIQGVLNPYDNGGAVDRVIDVLCRTRLNGLIRKQFFDISGFQFD